MDFVIEIHLVMLLQRGNLTDSGIFQNCPGQCQVSLGLLGELAVLYLLESSGCSPRGPQPLLWLLLIGVEYFQG